MPNDRELQLLRQAMTAGITSRKELANFMAQVCHESGGLTRMEEGFRYTRGIEQIPVRSARRQGLGALEVARIEALNGRPEQLADLMYGGRMGNDQPDDGYAYRGRGYMQLTGKSNYRGAGEAIGSDLVSNPDLAADPENAAKIAIWFWNQNVPRAVREDVNAATLAINGGTNGLSDRQTRYADWHQRLTPQFVESVLRSPQVSEVIGPPIQATEQFGQTVLGSNPSHADHALYLQALAGIKNLPHSSFSSDQERQNAAASLALEAKTQGLKQIDHVILNTTNTGLFAVQGRMDDPAHHRLYVDKAQAASQPIEANTQQMNRETQQPQSQQQQPQPTREPRLSM